MLHARLDSSIDYISDKGILIADQQKGEKEDAFLGIRN